MVLVLSPWPTFSTNGPVSRETSVVVIFHGNEGDRSITAKGRGRKGEINTD